MHTKRPLAQTATEAMNARRGAGGGGRAACHASAERHAATLQGPPVPPRLTHCAAPAGL